MSEEDIDVLNNKIRHWLECNELVPDEFWDDDSVFEEFRELLYNWGEPFYTKERNYN